MPCSGSRRNVLHLTPALPPCNPGQAQVRACGPQPAGGGAGAALLRAVRTAAGAHLPARPPGCSAARPQLRRGAARSGRGCAPHPLVSPPRLPRRPWSSRLPRHTKSAIKHACLPCFARTGGAGPLEAALMTLRRNATAKGHGPCSAGGAGGLPEGGDAEATLAVLLPQGKPWPPELSGTPQPAWTPGQPAASGESRGSERGPALCLGRQAACGAGKAEWLVRLACSDAAGVHCRPAGRGPIPRLYPCTPQRPSPPCPSRTPPTRPRCSTPPARPRPRRPRPRPATAPPRPSPRPGRGPRRPAPCRPPRRCSARPTCRRSCARPTPLQRCWPRGCRYGCRPATACRLTWPPCTAALDPRG
jgi:hypothetical protein